MDGIVRAGLAVCVVLAGIARGFSQQASTPQATLAEAFRSEPQWLTGPRLLKLGEKIDFEFYLPGIHGVIEVKEVNHLCRLPHKNFTLEAVAKLRKRSHASGHVSVLVYFTPVDQWRILGLTPFFSREGGSWDLGLYKLHPTATAALDSLGLFL